MRYRLLCDVEGDLHIRERKPATSEHDGVRYELITDDKGRAMRAAVSLQVPVEKLGQIGTSLGPPLPGSNAKLHINISTDPDLHTKLVEALQRMESLLAVTGRGPLIRRVRWDVVSREYITENESDEQYAAINAIAYKENKRMPTHVISHNNFEIMIQNADRYESLRIVSAFWREGIVALQDSRFIQAVYSFYFVLEDMFGQNKTDEKQVLEFFKRSESLTRALAYSVGAFPNGNVVHMSTLQSFLQETQLSWDVDGLRVFLIRMRGRLHHYKGGSSLRQGTPFTQGDFHAVALLFMHVVAQVIIGRMVEINRHAGPPKGPPPESSQG